MAGFKVSLFKGIRPKISALKLGEGEAVTASNVKLGSGDLEPWKDRLLTQALDDTFFNRTIYLFDNDSDPIWFEWSSVVEVTPGTVKGDELERTYYTGDGVPKMTYRTIAATGPGPYPTAFRNLGIPAPTVAPTVEGIALPETLDSDERRTVPGSMLTKEFEIVFVNFTIFPGSGSTDEQWNKNAAATGDITFNLQPGDSVRVTEVVDEDTVLLGSATGTGAFAATAANNKTSNTYFHEFDENGSTQEADWVGWRLPDGVEVKILGHLLRKGDVIRVTRVDFSEGILFAGLLPAVDFFEQDWATPLQVTIDGSTFFQVPNARVAADVEGITNFAALSGGFYYDVDRAASAGSVLEDRTYVYTYVSSLGEEGPPSPISAVVEALDGDTINITGMELPPTEFLDITEMRLYRTNSTDAGTEYQFVSKFPISTVTSESVIGSRLGEIIPSTSWDKPPVGLRGITSLPNGMMVGFKGKTIHMAEPYFPHAWPPEFDQAVDYNIVGLAALGNSVIILTDGFPYILTGAHPRNANIRPYKINQACISALSIATTADSVVYSSPDGLVRINSNGAQLVTEDYIDKSDWAAFVPDSIVGKFHDEKYFGFFDGIFNVPQPPATLFLTGDITTAGEEGIQAGGNIIILTLVSDTWLDAGSAFDDERQTIIDGILSAQGFITGWNLEMRPNIPVTDVVRTNANVVTITLTARTQYSLIDSETMEVTILGTALTAGNQLVADKTFTIDALQDYTSRAIAFTDFDVGGVDVPFSISSVLDITDWDSRGGVGSSFKDEVDITAAAYANGLSRWLALGFRDAGAPVLPNTTYFATSDDDGVTWVERKDAFLGAGVFKKPRAVIWYEKYGIFIAGGALASMQSSVDGELWLPISISTDILSSTSFVDFAIGDATAFDFVYAACDNVNFLARSPSLRLQPVGDTWKSVTTPYVSATGTRFIESGNGVIVAIGNFNTDMEIVRLGHGSLIGTSVGAVSTFNCQGFAFGDRLWVAVSNDFRIVTVDVGDEATIGNWSTPSASKAANVTIHGLAFDEGDGITQGYGYIAFGVNTSSSKGVVYTSPDAVTWTLRHTQTESIPVKAMAVKFPESDRTSVKLTFSPTFNGAQSPAQIGNTESERTASGFTFADAETDLTVKLKPNDAVINIVGRATGQGSIVSAIEQADIDIFNLNEEPDTVRITLTSLEVTGLGNFFGGSSRGSAGTQGEPFTDAQFFKPVATFPYGYFTDARSVQNTPPGGTATSSAIMIVTFTFRKEGFFDLSVSYKVRSFAEVVSP